MRQYDQTTQKEGEEQTVQEMQGETDSSEWTVSSVDSDGLLTPEGAFDKLYAAVFAPEGYTYECTYNAKGNFYAILSEWETENGDQKLHVRKTAVYDRISKNGKCQLFVCYNEYTTLDGSEWNAEISNFYAVDRQTGEVTAGNKTSWSQPASKAYQEATGDK